MKMNIFVVAVSYPDKNNLSVGNYVKNLFDNFNSKKTIICIPTKIINKRKNIQEIDCEYNVVIKRPRYINIFFLFRFFRINSVFDISAKSLYETVERIFIEAIEKDSIDVLYGHFLWPSGYIVKKLAKKYNLPCFVAVGESNLERYADILPEKYYAELSSGFNGYVFVSKKNYEKYKSIFDSANMRYLISPNQANENIFFPMDKRKCRDSLGYSYEKKILIFVGQFIERKGILNVVRIMDSLSDEYALICIGKGNVKVKHKRIIYSGVVKHSQLPIYLNAADVFILPTKAEGSCNSIAEAIACGLPVISSEIKEVKEQVFDDSSLLVDPESLDDILKGIKCVFEDINIYKENALKNSKKNSLKKRSESIYEFICGER